MATKNPRNPETPTNPEVPEIRQELGTLETQITWDRRKFEALLRNSTFKNWLNKIFQKEAEHTISWFWEWYKVNEINRHLFVESWTKRAIKSHPDLAIFICWDLWLPYSDTSYISGTKFNELTFEQKIWFISFQEALRYYNWDISRISSRDFINQCKILMNEHAKSMTDRFNAKLTNSQNLFQEVTGLVELKKFLKKEYALTDAECKKMEEFIELTYKHPEYVWWGSTGWIKYKEAWVFPWKEFFVVLKRLIIAWFSIWWVNELKSCSSITTIPAETKVYGDHTEIIEFKETFKVMSAVAVTDSHKRPIHEDGFGHVDLWWSFIADVGESFINWLADIGNITGLENRDMVMRINCENYYTFDFEWVRCFVEKKNWKRMVRLTWVKKPEVITNITSVEILESHREKIINLNKFDDFEIRAQETLKQEANKKASTSDKIAEAEKSLGEQILWVFQSLWCHNSEVDVEWKDIQGIIIEYKEDEIPDSSDIEGVNTRRLNN